MNLVSIFRYSSSSSNPVYESHVISSYLGSSLSSHRQSYIGLVFSSRFIDLIINSFLPHACTQVHLFSKPYLTDVSQLRETEVSKCVWQQIWCFCSRTLPVPPLLVYDNRDGASVSVPSPPPPSLLMHVHRCIGSHNPTCQTLPNSVRLTYLSVYDNRNDVTQCMWDV